MAVIQKHHLQSWLPDKKFNYLKCVKAGSLSHVRLFPTPWTVAHQDPLSMGFSRQEYWSGLPCPPPGHLPDPGIERTSPVPPALQVDSLPLSHWGSPTILNSSFIITLVIKLVIGLPLLYLKFIFISNPSFTRLQTSFMLLHVSDMF